MDLAHHYWKRLLGPRDHLIDATCGNGQDTLVLAQLAFTENTPSSQWGTLHALDIQQEALDKTQVLLTSRLPQEAFAHLHFHHRCHSTFPDRILPGSLRLIVYNSGYLPGGDKHKTTQRHAPPSASLTQALPLLQKGGCISLTAYPGHPTGKRRGHALAFCDTLLLKHGTSAITAFATDGLPFPVSHATKYGLKENRPCHPRLKFCFVFLLLDLASTNLLRNKISLPRLRVALPAFEQEVRLLQADILSMQNLLGSTQPLQSC